MLLTNDKYEKIIAEYISKCECCDECFATCFCTENGLRKCREPQDYCIQNIKLFLEVWSANCNNHSSSDSITS